MGYDLQVPVADLNDCGSRLHTVATEFQNAGDISDSYSDAVGHGGLKDKLHSMASNWKDHRNDMLGDIQHVGQSAQAAGENFGGVDKQLADELRNYGKKK